MPDALAVMALGAPESAIAVRVFLAGGPQIAAVVVAPQLVLEDVLGVGRLPQHEIAGSLLSRGPQEKVYIGDVGPLQVAGDCRLGDPLGVQPARLREASDFPCGFGDFGPATVVHAVIDRDDVVAPRHRFRDRQFIDHAAPQAGPRSHPPDPDPDRVEVHTAHAHDVAVEPHQETDFLGGTLPVLGGKSVEAQPLDPEFDCTADDVNHDGLAGLMTVGTAESALGGPAAIAVHHD